MFQRQTPSWIEKRLTAYGKNAWGGPLFRIVWSDTRRAWSLLHKTMWLRYPGHHCWVLERWCPPLMYGSRHAWENMRDWEPGSPTFGVPVLGPYPARGDYEPVYKFEELPSSAALPRPVMELVCRLIEAGKAHTKSERWAAIKHSAEKADRDWQKFFDDYCADKLSAISCRSGLRFGLGKNAGTYRGEQRGPDQIKFKRSTKDLPTAVRAMPHGFGQLEIPAEVKKRLLKQQPGTMVQ
jgi:hypothetical protein